MNRLLGRRTVSTPWRMLVPGRSVVFFASHAHGGVREIWTNLAKGFHELGSNAQLVGLYPLPSIVEPPINVLGWSYFIPGTPSGIGGKIRLVRELARWMMREKPEVIISSMPAANVLVPFFARIFCPRTPIIAFLGLIGQRRGTDVLIEALAMLARRNVPFRAVIAGNGAVEEAIAQAKALNIIDRLDFPGWIGEAEADAVLNAADIFVLPSRAENQPVSILEAMARGVPVVATRVGAIPEQIDDGTSGLLVNPGEAEPLAEALERLILSPDAHAAMGAAGQVRFASDFSVAACARRFADVYRSL